MREPRLGVSVTVASVLVPDMPDDIYSVKINRRDGIVEITGPDKDWIAEQLERLAVVYGETPPDEGHAGGSGAGAQEDETGTGGKSTRAKPRTDDDEATPRRRARGSGGSRGKRNDELAGKLTPEVRSALDVFVEERRPNFTDGPNQAAILAAFLQTELSWSTVAPDDLYTIYDMMGWPGPVPKSALDNAKTRKNYFTSAGRGKYQLSHTGERFGRHEAKNPSEDKS